jgi:hypothetical protein
MNSFELVCSFLGQLVVELRTQHYLLFVLLDHRAPNVNQHLILCNMFVRQLPLQQSTALVRVIALCNNCLIANIHLEVDLLLNPHKLLSDLLAISARILNDLINALDLQMLLLNNFRDGTPH